MQTFLKSIDYRDICYFIDHVENIEFRKSLLEELGYKIGIEITKENQERKIYIGRRKEMRMFISNKFNKVNIAYSVVLNNY